MEQEYCSIDSRAYEGYESQKTFHSHRSQVKPYHRMTLYLPFAAASSWRIFAMVAAEGSLRFLFFCRRLVLVV